MKPPSIPLFREINECHAATGFPLRTDLPGFHVFTLDETYPCSRQAMPTHFARFFRRHAGCAPLQFRLASLRASSPATSPASLLVTSSAA